jgi:hypothetical protein
VEDERSYYHIAWTAFGEDGNEKEVPLSITTGDDERVVLLFDSFERAKRYMHTFLAKEGIAKRRDLEPNMALITVMGGPVLGSPDPAHVFSVGEKTPADALARAGRKAGASYALLNPGPLTPSVVRRSRVPLTEL